MPVKPTTSPLLLSELFGQTERHLVSLSEHDGVQVNVEAQDAFAGLIAVAQSAGFQLRVASGFRHFNRQCLIWNGKCSGVRSVVDSHGNPVEVSSLAPLEKIEAILRWSALPGLSRHHWGSECDIYDAAAMPPDYQLQLDPAEYKKGGIFAPMMNWLCEYLSQSDSPDFYFPYATDRGGVAPEPWHISYRPVAERYQQYLSLALVKECLQPQWDSHSIEELAALTANLPSIYTRFVVSE